ncbi:MAG: aminotransferase class V-fold PLP-dependent enzyme [Sphaerochaetaceae bacterium]
MLDRKLIDEEYAFLGNEIFLNVSSVVMPPKRVQEAYGSFMADYVRNFGDDIVPRAWAIVNEARPKLAKLINATDPHEIAFVKNTCEGISIVADGYPLKPGDNVVIADQEHQANLFPWINVHQRKGVELKVVKSVEGEIRTQDMIDMIDGKTKILTISAAQFSTGYFADLATLGAECHKRGVVFVVDGIQVLGRLEIDVQKLHIDYLVAGSNKGLLGSLGAGFVYCSDRIVKDIIPPYASYQSVVSHVAPPAITSNFDSLEWYPHARRFESGNLSYNCILAISKGVDLLLELGIKNIEAHVRSLETHLRSLLSDLPLHVVQAKDPANWSGIVCVYYPAESDDAVIRILQRYRIHATMRGGYTRFGIDFYNTMKQMEQVSKALHEVAELTGR